MALRRWGGSGGSSARPPAHRCKVDARDARRLAGAVDRQVPDARRHAVRQADRGLFLGAAAVREAGFPRAPLALEIDLAHREAFVMTKGKATPAVVPVWKDGRAGKNGAGRVVFRGCRNN